MIPKSSVKKKREALYDQIIERAASYAIASASVEEIEIYNILGATFLAMRRAAEGLDPAAQKLLVDGNRLPPQLPSPAETIVKGDTLSESVAAASILAKVSRDRLMAQLALNILNIILISTRGMVLFLHYQCLQRYGVSPVHRRSFLTKWLEAQNEREGALMARPSAGAAGKCWPPVSCGTRDIPFWRPMCAAALGR